MPYILQLNHNWVDGKQGCANLFLGGFIYLMPGNWGSDATLKTKEIYP